MASCWRRCRSECKPRPPPSARGCTSIRSAGIPRSGDLGLLPIVQDAIARDCKLTFLYSRADGESGVRTVDPFGIVAKQGIWYLVARAPAGMRTYRISRMQDAVVLAVTFERPANFDLAAHWKTATAQLQQKREQFRATLGACSRCSGRRSAAGAAPPRRRKCKMHAGYSG